MPSSLVDDVTARLLEADRKLLTSTRIPIVTVSASFVDVLEARHNESADINHPDIVFSRAHYSMALGLAITAWGEEKPNEKKAWLIDPTNYVASKDWRRVAFTETVGRTLARHSILGWLKRNILDTRGRKKLPITPAITPPLLHVTEGIEQPIVSMHITAGNILAQTGKKIVQVITDPHVRPEYLDYAHLPTTRYCVFDERTRTDFFEIATTLGKKVNPDHVIVTGPPIDPRVVAARDQKRPTSWRRRPLRILLTTGGVGTNKQELKKVLEQLLPLTRRRQQPLQIVYYAGTNEDHAKMVRKLAAELHIKMGNETDRLAGLRLLYADDIVSANALLIKYGFPWADIVMTKPSGDMAYDAVAAGCALLLLSSWGEWEDNIASVFLQLEVARKAQVENIAEQLRFLMTSHNDEPWLEQALQATRKLPPHFTRGCTNILQVVRSF